MTRTGDRRPQLAALLLGVLLPALAWAKPSIEADISAPVIGLGEEALFTVTISDAAGGEPELPRFGELNVNGPQVSTQTSIMLGGGRQTFQTSKVYTWSVTAPHEGLFVIGPAKLAHNGQVFTTSPVEVRCEGRAQPRVRPSPQRRNPFSALFQDPFDALDEDFPAGSSRRAATGEQDVFLKAVTDKSEAYLGEQVTLSLYLFSQVDVSGVQSVSFPKLDGFWAEDIEAPTQLAPEIKNVKGVPYRAYLLRRRALFPLQAGELVIDPVEAQISLGMSMFFGAPQDSVKRKSASAKLKVKPLPPGEPAGFEASNVGEMSLSARATPQRTSLGQPVQLRVVLEGTGNLKSVRIPSPKLPSGLKTYDPTVTDKLKPGNGRYGGSKTLEWVIIPERTGTFTIPPIEVPHFDPSRGHYEVARTQPITVDVAPAADGSTSAPQPGQGAVAPAAANVLEGGIRPIRTNASLAAAAAPVWEQGWFWPLTAGPLAAWGLVWSAGLVLGAARRRDPEQQKKRRARGHADKRLKQAASLLNQGDARGFHAEVARTLQQFVQDKAGVPAAGLTSDELRSALTERGLSSGAASAIVELISSCETARFAPSSPSQEALETTLEAASRAIDALDGFKPGRPS